MRNKAEQRSRPNPENPRGKETQFEYGPLVLTKDDVRKRFQRANLAIEASSTLDVSTPSDVIYKTPCEVIPSPGQTSGLLETWSPALSPGRPQIHSLPSKYKDHTLVYFEKVQNEAHRLEIEGDSHAAEEKYREAMTGFEHILSPTHKVTNELAYRLATLYVDRDCMGKADEVLNQMYEKLIRRWGFSHENTINHLLRVSKLYNNWSRTEEALSLLYRVLDIWDDPVMNGEILRRHSQHRNIRSPGTSVQHQGSDQMPGEWAHTYDPLRRNYQLSLANNKLLPHDSAAEETLMLLIDQCESHRQKLSPQLLQARCTLIKVYSQQHDNPNLSSALEQAREEVHNILALKIQDTGNDMLKACIEVGKLHLENGRQETAEDMFQSIAEKAEDGPLHMSPPNITILIHIGKLYQSRNTWQKAKPWFERALAASMATTEWASPLTKALDAALKNRHYCYSFCEDAMLFTFDEIRKIGLVF
ncbi:MAG: hypothetical protein LQ337_005892 [Flavoplaca oasis]|nr:MAG: hypothetical protein LQ337_005892 [Flavoplaca oasis]